MQEKTKWYFTRALCVVATALALYGGASRLEAATGRDMEQYFAGKTITVIVGSSAGGGADFNARLFARFASKYFPGKPKFIVQNIPGSAQLKGLQAGMRAKPDGLTVASLNTRWAIKSMLGEDLGPFNIKTARIVGSPIAVSRAEIVCTDRKFAGSWEEIVRSHKTLKFPGGPGGRSDLGPYLLELVGAPVKNISGYGGVAEETAAFNRGELTGVGCNEATVPRLFPEWLKEKRLAPLFWWDAPPSPEYLAQMGVSQNVPNLLELSGVNFPLETKAVVNVALQIFAFTRALVLPPKVPDDIYQAWVKGYEATSKDTEMLEVASKGGHDLRLGRPEEFRRALADFEKLSPSGLELFKKLALEKD
jgi:tripartite-type tricarboxylate transporter receptor subunit TctC